jgi:hypothetical protein
MNRRTGPVSAGIADAIYNSDVPLPAPPAKK